MRSSLFRFAVAAPRNLFGQWAAYARSMYSPVRVSIRIISPSVMNMGTRIYAPVYRVAVFRLLVAVSPFTPGSVLVTSSSTKLGGSTPNTLSL